MCLSPRWHMSISTFAKHKRSYLRVRMCLSQRWHVSISALACVYLRVDICPSPRLQERSKRVARDNAGLHVSISVFAREKQERSKRVARENAGLHVSISGLRLPSRAFVPFCAFHGCAREGQEFCGCTWTHSAIMCTADEPRAGESVRSRPLRSRPFSVVRSP